LLDGKKLQAVGLDPEAVISTVTGRHDAFILPEDLPRFWLEKLGWFLLDQRTRTNAPTFIAHLLSNDLKAEWNQAKRNFLALSGASTP